MLTADPAILICTVGGSPAPVIHGIRSHRPEHVLFVCSRASVPSVKEQILPALDFLPEWNILPLSNEQDLLACVMEIRACITAFLDARHLPADTALLGDFTGGTKVMSAALVMALMERNVQFTYTGGGQRSKDGLGIVRDGEEQIMHLANPWQVLAFAHIRQMADAFNACRFSEAERLAGLVADHGVHPAFFAALATLFRAYALWDGFRYAEAKTLFEQAITEIESEAPPSLATFLEQVKINSLALKATAAELSGFMEHQRPCPNYLRDLAANALRREVLGCYDDAVARLYSLLEKAAKTSLLSEYGLDTSSLSPESLPQDFLKESSPVISHDGVMQLPLFRAYQLLARLRHPLGLRFMEYQEELQALLHARNFSLLAHGFAPVTAETCTRLRNVVLAFLNISVEDLTKFPDLAAVNLE